MNKFRVLAVVLVFCAGLGWGATFTWTGNFGDDRWDTPGNWDLAPSVPSTSTFPGYDLGTMTRSNDTATFTSSATVLLPSLIASGNLGSVTILASGTLTLASAVPSGTELNLPELKVGPGLGSEWLTAKGTFKFSAGFQIVFDNSAKSLSIISDGNFTIDGSGAEISSSGG
ncbi:MAG: hypothetical protein LBB68_07390, partial [Treponema sp.]|nr:hypothetical protein [Treponema sp.]